MCRLTSFCGSVLPALPWLRAASEAAPSTTGSVASRSSRATAAASDNSGSIACSHHPPGRSRLFDARAVEYRGGRCSGCTRRTGQETAAFTSSTTFFSTAELHPCRAYDIGQMSPSSRFAASWKPRVENLYLNLPASWKKTTTLPSAFA